MTAKSALRSRALFNRALYQLRHTRGTELVEEGKPLEIVQRVLGHRDIRSTQGYADLSEAQVREVLEG
jgi:integrase/recombinase XerD